MTIGKRYARVNLASGPALLRAGDTVVCSAKLRREWVPGLPERKEWRSKAFREPRECVVVGVRTVSNGELRRDCDEGYSLYNPTKHFQALLLVDGIRNKPFLARPEHVWRLP